MEDIVKNRRWLKFKKEPCPKFLIENKNYIQKEKNKEEIKKFIYVWLSENKKREKLKYVSLSLF